mgnify:CR=1 FL=1
MTTTNALLDALRDMDDDDLRELAYGVGCTANELWDLVLRPMNELYDEVLDARHGDDERLLRQCAACARTTSTSETRTSA